MSHYTTELRFICENLCGYHESQNAVMANNIIKQAAPLIFDFDFPIFDESYRKPLEEKIIRHFYTREIGVETVGLWKFRLQTLMNELMPYYNLMYKTTLLEFNPFYDTELTTTNNGTKQGTTTTDGTNNGSKEIKDNVNGSENYSNNETIRKSGSSSDTTDDSSSTTTSGSTTSKANGSTNKTRTDYDLYSQTPQGAIVDLDTGRYLTDARKQTGTEGTTTEDSGSGTNESESTFTDKIIKSGSNSNDEDNVFKGEKITGSSGTRTETNSGSNKETSSVNSTEDYITKVIGKSGGESYSKLLKEFRSTFINLDMQLINDLEPLFMQIW